MSDNNKFGMLRKILQAIGLSQQAADDAVDFIVDLLAGEGKGNNQTGVKADFPYHIRDNFLSPAEFSFFKVLQGVVGERAYLCTKVNLSDVFWVKSSDASSKRTYTNKIDRKHLDFLLCDPQTMQPILGIELDDKSHQRQDRQERDAFVDEVFKAANLPLVHIPVKGAYVPTELASLIAPYLPKSTATVQASSSQQAISLEKISPVSIEAKTQTCPKCGSEMLLRTAKKGVNACNQFWGCSNYPNCRTMLESN